MPMKKSKTLCKSLNERNAERRWSAENVDFAAILDGENEFIRAKDTATDSSSESVTADAATTSIKMSLSKFGFTCGVGKQETTCDNETKNKKAKYDAYKERQNEYETHRVRSFQQP